MAKLHLESQTLSRKSSGDFMTHTEISNLAGNRLVELNNMYLHDAVNSCLSEPVNVSNIGDVVSEITNLSLIHL